MLEILRVLYYRTENIEFKHAKKRQLVDFLVGFTEI